MAVSQLLLDIVGKRVAIKDVVLGMEYTGTVTDLDEKWLRIEDTNKKGVTTVRIVAVDSIGSVAVL